MSERTTTPGGSAQNQERDGEARGSAELGGAPPESTLAATNGPAGPMRVALAELHLRAGDFRREAYGEHPVALGADIMLRSALKGAEDALTSGWEQTEDEIRVEVLDDFRQDDVVNLVYEVDGREPACALATTVAGALQHIGRAGRAAP